MRIVFIAHKLSGDIEGNCTRVRAILKKIMERSLSGALYDWKYHQVFPIAPYLQSVEMLNDAIPHQREIGIEFNDTVLKSGIVKELWVCSAISEGVLAEIVLATRLGLPVQLMLDIL